jgi:uncharacterized protein (UPF0254 family)
LRDLLSDHINTFDFTFVENRKEAGIALKQSSFDQVVTALKIPRISDGYVFLGQIVDKQFKKEDIIVVVEEKNDNVIASINSRGVEQIYPATNLKDIATALVKRAGLTSGDSNNVQATVTDVYDDLEKVKTVLNYVMGPVGNLIFNDAVSRWSDHNNFNKLLTLIQNEIQDQDKIKLFQDSLN